MTKQQFIDDISQLSPADVLLVTRIAQMFRAAQDAGNVRIVVTIAQPALTAGDVKEDPPCS